MSVNATGSLSADDPRIQLTPPPPPPPPPSVHDILVKAATDQGVDPNLLLAVSFWESSWRVDAVSSEGAIGLLQVMPKTAATAGPAFLGRAVNLNDPADNAEIGAALLKDLLNKYDTRTALAAYYQGEPALLTGNYAWDTWHYADGILTLRNQIAAGQGPPAR
jgi:soluble lytic murein transglycosylase-like protein